MNRRKTAVLPRFVASSAPRGLPENSRNGTHEPVFDWIIPIRFRRPGPEPARKPAAPVPSFWPLRGPF